MGIVKGYLNDKEMWLDNCNVLVMEKGVKKKNARIG